MFQGIALLSVGFFYHRPKIPGQCAVLEGEGGEGVRQHPHDADHEQDRPGPHRSGQPVSNCSVQPGSSWERMLCDSSPVASHKIFDIIELLIGLRLKHAGKLSCVVFIL